MARIRRGTCSKGLTSVNVLLYLPGGLKQEEEADTRIIVIELKEILKKITWARRRKVPNKT